MPNIHNLRIHPFTGADQSIELTETFTVPASGSPYVYLSERPLESKPFSVTATLPGSTSQAFALTDTYVYEGTPSFTGGSLTLFRTGTDGVPPAEAYRPLIKFDLSGLPPVAGTAKAWFFLQDTTGIAGYPATRNIGIHELLGAFSDTTNWTTQPSHNVVAEDVVQIGSSAWYSVDITDLYNSWQAGTKTNYGVMLKDGNEYDSDTARDFSSTDNPSNKPYLEVMAASANMVKVGSVLPAAQNEYVVNFQRGCVAVHSSLAGGSITVNYWGGGTNMHADLLMRELG